MCDTAYVLQVEQIHAQAVAADAWGAGDGKQPQTVTMRRDFDDWLVSNLAASESTGRTAALRAEFGV